MLENALDALHGRHPKRRQGAVDWFRFPDANINLCDVREALGLDPVKVRRRVLPVIRRASTC